MKTAQQKEEAEGQESKKPVRQYADPIDEEALHDQLMAAIMSEEEAHAEARAELPRRPPEEGRGVEFELVDPIRKPASE